MITQGKWLENDGQIYSEETGDTICLRFAHSPSSFACSACAESQPTAYVRAHAANQ